MKQEKYSSDFWDFKGKYRTKLHTLGHYPATMVPEMQLKLMEDWAKKDYKVMLDPFMGSGTSLVEAQRLGMDVIGVDINPYAVLLTQVKTHNFSNINWEIIKLRLHKKLNCDSFNYPIHSFNKINKWFREDIIKSLSKVRNIIKSEKDNWVRKFLWICMSDTIYTHSNDRNSTFKLYQKSKSQINNISNDVLLDFEKIVSEKSKFLIKRQLTNVTIYSGDSIKICSNLNTESIDMICTSPPYGENATTVTYGQASILFLKWIDTKDLASPNVNKLLCNFSTIDSLSLGGINADQDIYSSKTFENYLNSITFAKRKKVRRFISDYWKVIKQLARITKVGGAIIFTIGNRVVDNKVLPLDKLTIEMFKKLKVRNIQNFSRHILSKRTPPKIVLNKNGKKIVSMDKEKVLVFRKEK